jgi:hypothetical protein
VVIDVFYASILVQIYPLEKRKRKKDGLNLGFFDAVYY